MCPTLCQRAGRAGTASVNLEPFLNAAPSSSPQAPLCPTDPWAPSHQFLNPAWQPPPFPKSPLLPTEAVSNFSWGPWAWGLTLPGPLLHYPPHVWHRVARSRVLSWGPPAPGRGTSCSGELPLPRNCPPPGLSVPQLLTLIHVQGEQQWSTINLVFPEGDGKGPL